MIFDFPLEILWYIFQYQDKWVLLKNGNKIINVEKLRKIPTPMRIHESRSVYTIILRISSSKMYYLEFWTIWNDFPSFVVTLCINYKINHLLLSSDHTKWVTRIESF